jgi:hypothetical protein
LGFAPTTRTAACPSVNFQDLTQAIQGGFLLQQSSAFLDKPAQKFHFVLQRRRASHGVGSKCLARLDKRVAVTVPHALEAESRLAILDFVRIHQMEESPHAP